MSSRSSTLSSAFSLYRRSARALAPKSLGLGAFAAGGAALAALPSAAQAQMVSTTFTGPVTLDSTHTALYLSMTTGATGSSSFTGSDFRLDAAFSAPGKDPDGINTYLVFDPSSSNNGRVATYSAAYFASNFSPGNSIDSASTFNILAYFDGHGSNAPKWSNATSYVGVKFDIAGATHYGWVEVTTNSDTSVITLVRAGYNATAGAAALVGSPAAVPEPATSAALLALGAAGLAAYRQRRSRRRPA